MSDTYSDALYASPRGTGQNNCYAYAIDYYRNRGDDKLQPGDLAKIPGNVDLKNCDDLVARALADAKAMGWSLEVSDACRDGGYLIAAVLAPNDDFHWYRHHKDVLYRIKTPRSKAQLAKEFAVPMANVDIPGPDTERADVGDVVLIKNANVWSHKQGFSPDGPLLRDACGNLIKDVKKACRNYGTDMNYKHVCATFCFKKNKNVNGRK